MTQCTWPPLIAFASLSAAQPCAAIAQTFSSEAWWPPSQREVQASYEQALNARVSTEHLRNWHELLGTSPHVAGTPGDWDSIRKQRRAFNSLGLEVQTHEFWPLLARPVEARLEIVAADDLQEPMQLPLQERPLEEDQYTTNETLGIGWNAYSGSGDVVGEVVYANQGTKSDFARLRELGIDLTGKIVLARYGGNYRGYKAKFAEQAGAAGLIIYTDPADSGYMQGVPYPQGGWANESHIQRGSIKTLEYPGDALTPGIPANRDAQRLESDLIELPRIPVQPIGYGAACEIMSRMSGMPLPRELVKSWQGGLPFAYRVTGGTHLNVRLAVKQERFIGHSANVVATIPGATHPHQKIIIGCHHDAWGHGASDPLAGTILVFEAARCFSELAKNGQRPARSIVFATWGAEEFGIIGSTEYCEAHREELMRDAVAYINLDMAAMGPHFRASASPSLKRLIEEAARDVPQVPRHSNQSVFGAWRGERSEPAFGNLGGGSDHIGFYCHLGIPSCGLSADGGAGTAYHSNYDTLAWYRKVVGDDYEPAVMMTQVVNLLAARLANAPLLPLDPVRYATDGQIHLDSITDRAAALGRGVDSSAIAEALSDLEHQARETASSLHDAVSQEKLVGARLDAANGILLHLERRWLAPGQDGLPGRPWFRNLFAAADPDSGYAAWMLPALRAALERGDDAEWDAASGLVVGAANRLRAELESLELVATRENASTARP